jgi:proline dehydrogenase
VNPIGRSLLAVTDLGPVRKLFCETGPGRAVSTRFVAGETLDQAAVAAAALNAKGARVSLDHLGEHVGDRGQALAARDDYLACLDRIDADGLDSNISIKLTQLGLGFDDDLAAEALDALAARASTCGTSVTVDMEESEHTGRTIDIYEDAQRRRGNVGIAVQACLHRTAADLDRIMPLDGHIRLCKGAYAEPGNIAFQSRSDVDANFDRLLQTLMAAENVRPAVATHDDALYTFSFLLLLYFAVFSVVSARERHWFWTTMPSRTLMVALLADTITGTILTRVGLPGLLPLPWSQTSAISAYALVACLVVNDTVKVVMIKWRVPTAIA